MLKKVLQDIQSIEKSLVQNGKYINKYDALSLSILDIDDDSNTIVTTPKMEGLQQLVTDISTVLSNGFDEVQTNLVDIDTGIIAVKTASEKLNRSVNSNNNVNYVSHSVTKEQVLKEKKNLSNKLQDLYDKITKLLEMKSRMLDSIENMFEVYYNSIVSCAMENGVLNTLDRANTVIDPFREEITHHSLLLHDKVRLHLFF